MLLHESLVFFAAHVADYQTTWAGRTNNALGCRIAELAMTLRQNLYH
ncbi:MAG: hypothetical protein ACC628_25475 [Pirellulaceae bacterium]